MSLRVFFATTPSSPVQGGFFDNRLRCTNLMKDRPTRCGSSRCLPLKEAITVNNPSSDYEKTVEAMISAWDTQIEELQPCARGEWPPRRDACRNKIGELILKREAVRRGLMRLDDEGDVCSSCP